jgi:hypothetical protein
MENSVPTPAPVTEVQDKPTEVPLVSIQVTDDNTALNLLVGFIGVAQKRGAFNVQESAKLWECIQRFTQQA